MTLELTSNQLQGFIEDVRVQKYIGANVTLPFKTQILQYCDHLSPTAKTLGALNTLYVRDGRVHGDNTDVYGFVANLDHEMPNWDKDKNAAIVLGAGGAARAIIYALIQRKFKTITILNRTLENAHSLAQYFAKLTTNTALNSDILDNFSTYAPTANILINASSIGLNATKFDHLALDLLAPSTLVHDIVYSPLQTPLLKDARNAGLKTVDGLGMLLHQAVPGFEKWFGVRPEVTSQLRQKVIATLR